MSKAPEKIASDVFFPFTRKLLAEAQKNWAATNEESAASPSRRNNVHALQAVIIWGSFSWCSEF